MKKLLTLFLAVSLVVSMAACGKSSEPTPSSKEPASVADTVDAEPEAAEDTAADASVMTEAEYEANIGEVITTFEELSTTIMTLISGYDDSPEWFATFGEIYGVVGTLSTNLAEMTAAVPESYQESHVKITIAIAAYADMMDAVGTATDVYKSGDTAKGDELMATAQGLAEGAAQLWSEAVVQK